jgi:rhamnosyltransferase
MINPSAQTLHNSANPTSCAVLLATYNGAHFLEEQIDSILSQSGVAVTIYARDDGSSDATREILQRYAVRYEGGVVILPDGVRRFGAACENFLSILNDTSGLMHDYFAFSDQDDIWLPDKLSRAISILGPSAAAGYASNLTAFDDAGPDRWTIRKATPQREFDHLFQSASAGCTYVFTRDAAQLIRTRLATVKDMDWHGMSHDWLCYAICRSYGLSWVIDDWSGILYRQHGQNQFGALPGWKGMLARLTLIRKGWYKATMQKNRAFLNADNRAEQEIFERLALPNVGNRLWLAFKARQFRRESKGRLALGAAILTGFL